LVVISELASEQPGELTRLALVRAKFCELLGEISPHKAISGELFIMGLFSLLDTMLGAPMDKIMDKLPIGRRVKDALAQRSGLLAGFLKVSMAFERNQQRKISSLLLDLKINPQQVPESYLTAVRYANGLL